MLLQERDRVEEKNDRERERERWERGRRVGAERERERERERCEKGRRVRMIKFLLSLSLSRIYDKTDRKEGKQSDSLFIPMG